METTSVNFLGFNFQYYIKDDVAKGCIERGVEWEPHITNFVKTYNNFYNIKNIIDVGANFGYHTLMFSKETSGCVFAFEPQIQNFELLKNNVQNNNLSNCAIYNLACGDKNCDVFLPVIENPIHSLNMGDFTPNNVLPENKTNFSISKSIILDELNFPKIDVIKIDVQGWEKKVLLGSRNLLKVYKPILIVEFEWFQLEKTGTTCQELFDLIRQNNYYIFYLEYVYPADHVCVHYDNLDEFKVKFKKYIFPHNTDNELNRNITCGVTEKIVIL
jgi:FkbM family methyltransferase